MADLIGELGLDTSEIEKSLKNLTKTVSDEMGKAAAASEKAAEKAAKDSEKHWKKIKDDLKKVAEAFGVALGIAAVGRYIANLRNLGSAMDEIRQKRISGSKEDGQFKNDTAGYGGAAGVTRAVGETFDRAALKVKIAVAESLTGLAMIAENAYNIIAKVMHFEPSHAVADAMRIGQAMEKQQDRIKFTEDEIGKLKSGNTLEYATQLWIAEKEVKLQEQKLALARLQGADGRDAQQAALAGLGAAEAAESTLRFEKEKSLATARAQTREMVLMKDGQKGAATELQIRLKYNIEIAEAIRAGRDDLAAQLALQKQIALQDAAVAEHNMTPKQRRDERTAARKLDRDRIKTNQHEVDLQARLSQARAESPEKLLHMPGATHMAPPTHMRKSGAPLGPDDLRAGGAAAGRFRGTPGSELDRFRQRRLEAANAKNDSALMKQDSAIAATFYKQGLQELKMIDSKLDSAFQNR